MDETPGSVGTTSSLSLRLGQALFSSASLLFMSVGVEFYSYTAFWYCRYCRLRLLVHLLLLPSKILWTIPAINFDGILILVSDCLIISLQLVACCFLQASEMADFTVRRLQQGHTRIKTVPIAVTPEGFWCCPSPAAIEKNLKNRNHQDKRKTASPPRSKASSIQRSSLPPVDKRLVSAPLTSKLADDDHSHLNSATAASISSNSVDRPQMQSSETKQRKIYASFGRPETSDMKVTLHGKEGSSMRMSVHRNVLAEHSSFFADKLSRLSPASQVEIADCEDVEIFLEVVGLMYCKEIKCRLIKRSLSRVLRILKVAESLGFHACIESCLDYLEAVPWVEEEEEQNVISSVRHLRDDSYGVGPILNRVASDPSNPPTDTLAQIMDLVLGSSEDRARREMKSLVLNLLKESDRDGSVGICTETLYGSCRHCLESLLNLFRCASEPGFSHEPLGSRDRVVRRISLEVDNLLWLVEILAVRHAADEFASIWASQDELAELHSKLPTMARHQVSCVTSRLFVAIGNREMLPPKETRKLLLRVWLQPLIDDYGWLRRGSSRSFDRHAVEEGIDRTITTLPLEEQQSVLLSWLRSFLKVGDDCPNLRGAFEVWWRRTFTMPYVEHLEGSFRSEKAGG
ncbi:unnamed protein product [Musa hybrid cultivar]